MVADNQQERLSVAEQKKWFLAGLIEGEGSVCVSIKAHPTARFGYYVDPEFFLYQLESNRSVLELASDVFRTGNIRPKPGNERVLVYSILSRRSLAERVVPFLNRYMIHSGRKQIYNTFCSIVLEMEQKEHHSQEGLMRIVRKAYHLNPAAKGKKRKRTLQEVIERILRDYTPDTDKSLSGKI